MLWRGAQAPCCRRPAGLPGTSMREVMHHRFSPLTAVVRSVWGKATQQEPALSAAPGGCDVLCSTDSMTRPTQPSPMATMLCHICSSICGEMQASKMPAEAAVAGVPLLPSSEQARCREGRLDRAMAQAIAGEALPCW